MLLQLIALQSILSDDQKRYILRKLDLKTWLAEISRENTNIVCPKNNSD